MSLYELLMAIYAAGWDIGSKEYCHVWPIVCISECVGGSGWLIAFTEKKKQSAFLRILSFFSFTMYIYFHSKYENYIIVFWKIIFY